MPSHAFDDARATTRRETVPAQRRATQSCSPYSPWDAAEELGLHIRYGPLRDSWAWWVPSRSLIIVANQLTEVEERCALAHEVEHARRNDDECGHNTALASLCARRQEARADEAAARKLIPVVDLEAVLRWATSPEEAAQELSVTEHMLRVRLRIRRRELECLDTLRIAG
ncbi:ImmA/IrrE family metallo-endopeptidase [Streptomyces sp. NPDC056149]|uniref:ImmA/IrrE family metallo-endopeptidase n=1 Tax=Streptomyces sp. NPDC056149 TaxID=3345728 RepID=UPI0035DC0E44